MSPLLQGLRVGAKLAGRPVKCPNTACGQLIDVPLPLDDEPVAQLVSRTGRSSPSPRRRSPASGTESSAALPPASQVRRARWPWYAGGVAALCIIAGVVLAIALSGKDRTKAGGAPGDADGTSGAPSDPSPIVAGEQFSLTKKSEFSSETKVEFILLAELTPKSKGKMFDFGVQTKDGERGPGGFGLESKWEITISGTIDSSSDARDWWIFQFKVKEVHSGSALVGFGKGPIRFFRTTWETNE